MTHRSSRRAEDGSVVAHYSRLWGVACVMFILVLASRAVEHGAATATVFATVGLVMLSVLAAAGAWSFMRARPVLIIDRSGLVFCHAGIRLEWSEIASVAIEEMQSPFDLSRRLSVSAVHPERLEELWERAPSTFGLTPPIDGQISLMLNFLTPRSAGIAEAIRECSAGQFTPELRSAARRRLGALGLGA